MSIHCVCMYVCICAHVQIVNISVCARVIFVLISCLPAGLAIEHYYKHHTCVPQVFVFVNVGYKCLI